jgi:hypothetical protein
LQTAGKYLEAQTGFRYIDSKMRVILLFGFCACARSGATRPTPPPPPPSEPQQQLVAWFGVWSDAGFERRTKIRKVAGQRFGWRIKTHCTGPIHFREVMKLPAPGDWTFTPDELPGTTISEEGTTTTTIDYAACKRGWVEHVWTVAAGDPVGTYVITVELEGYATQTFRPKFVDDSPNG